IISAFLLLRRFPSPRLAIVHYLCKNQQSHFQDTQTMYCGVTLKGCTVKIPWTLSARYLPLGPPQHLKVSLKSSLHQILNRFIKPGAFVYFLEVSSYRVPQHLANLLRNPIKVNFKFTTKALVLAMISTSMFAGLASLIPCRLIRTATVAHITFQMFLLYWLNDQAIRSKWILCLHHIPLTFAPAVESKVEQSTLN
ncbi:hypothetical protein DFH08DRAFT_1021626, partial [Mycena albidolilacea]